MTRDELVALAWRAVVTPSLEAPDAFAVLTDALLEAGLVTEPEGGGVVVLSEEFHSTYVAETLAGRAWEWACEATWLPLLKRMEMEISALDGNPAWRRAIERLAAPDPLVWEFRPTIGSTEPPPRLSVFTDLHSFSPRRR